MIITIMAIGAGFASLVLCKSYSGKCFSTAGLLAALAGFIQLDVSGFFDVVMREYDNAKKYNFGPPSYITREIIDNPDEPIRTALRNALFFNRHTGFYLIVGGTVLQVIGNWL